MEAAQSGRISAYFAFLPIGLRHSATFLDSRKGQVADRLVDSPGRPESITVEPSMAGHRSLLPKDDRPIAARQAPARFVDCASRPNCSEIAEVVGSYGNRVRFPASSAVATDTAVTTAPSDMHGATIAKRLTAVPL
jgi:hypothetical protein